MGKKGAWPWSRDVLFKFWDPLISLERLKTQTSNFACEFMLRDTKPENEKQGPTNISGTAGVINLKYCMQIDSTGY